MFNILFISWVVFILYILLETDVIPQYSELFKLKFMKYKEFNKQKEVMGGDTKYKYFLLSRYRNFFINLITCQECLCVWLNIVGFLIASKHFGGWFMFAPTTLGCILGIALFNFILRKFYE